MVDTLGSGSSALTGVLVRVQFWAKKGKLATQACLFLCLRELNSNQDKSIVRSLAQVNSRGSGNGASSKFWACIIPFEERD